MVFPKKMDITKYKNRIEHELRETIGKRTVIVILAHLLVILVRVALVIVITHHGCPQLLPLRLARGSYLWLR